MKPRASTQTGSEGLPSDVAANRVDTYVYANVLFSSREAFTVSSQRKVMLIAIP